MDIEIFASSSSGNCYRISDGKTSLLLDAGIPFKEIRKHLNFSVSAIEGCLISHEHGDHAKAIKDLVKAGIDCFMSEGTKAAVGVESHRIKTVAALQKFTVGSWTVLPFEAEHDAAEPLGYLLASSTGAKLLFATDTYYIRYMFKGLTHIMVECNYSADILQRNVERGAVPETLKNRLLKSHFSLEHVKDFLIANDLSKVETIYLLHLSDGNSDEARFKREIQALTGKMVVVAK